MPGFKGINKMIELLFKMMFLLRIVKYIPWTQEMRNKTVEGDPYQLKYVPERVEMQKLCNDAVQKRT